MILFATIFMFVCINCNKAIPDENPSMEAQAALALAKAKQLQCVCKEDKTIEVCREESKKTGKPLVLSVNVDCKGVSSVFGSTAIFCKVKSYTEEGQADSNAPRFVIISPDEKGGQLYIRKTLSPTIKLTEFEGALKTATKVPQTKQPLNWK